MDITEKINLIKSWAEKFNLTKYGLNRPFDISFIESIENWLEDNNELTILQEQSVDNIISKFKIK